MTFFLGGKSIPAAALLRRRVQKSLAETDPSVVLEDGALIESMRVLHTIVGERHSGGDANVRPLADVIVVHLLRSDHLNSSQDRHAAMAIAVWLHVIDPDGGPPQLRDEVTALLQRGAASDEPAAMLAALQGQASAVRAAFLRSRNPGLADTFVDAFARLLEHTDPSSPFYPTRLADLGAAYFARYQVSASGADPADLERGVELTGQVLAHPSADEALLRRAHKLHGPMLVARLDRRAKPTDFASAVRSFRALIDLAADPAARAQHEQDLAALHHQYGR